MIGKIGEWLKQKGNLNEEPDTEHALQMAAAILLLEVSRADFDISEDELEVIQQALESQFDLSKEEGHALLQLAQEEHERYTSAHAFIRILNESLEAEQKEQLLASLWRVAYADQMLDKYEEYHVRKIADWLYLSHSDFIRIKSQVVAELNIPRDSI